MAPKPDLFFPGQAGGATASGKLLGLPKPVVYVAAAVGAFVAYKYFKSRSSSGQNAPQQPACYDGTTPDPTNGLCQNGLYPGQLPGVITGAGGGTGSGGGSTGGGGTGGGPGIGPCPNAQPRNPDGTCPPPVTPGPGGGGGGGGGGSSCNTIWIHGNPGHTFSYCGDPNVPAWFQIGQQWYYYTPGTTPAGYPGSAGPGTPPPGTEQTNQSTSLQAHQVAPSPLGLQGAIPDFAHALTSPTTTGTITGAGVSVVQPAAVPPVMPPSGKGLPTPPAGQTAPATAGAGWELSRLTDDHLHLVGQNSLLTAAGGPRPNPPPQQPPPPPQPTATGHGPHWVPPPFRWPLPKPGR